MGNEAHIATFFAAMNTPDGLISFFRDIFDDCEKIFILKGGPGTGKSRLMRDVAESAEENGYAVERVLCSSDPLSLDGIIIKDLSVAIVDGTAPHIYPVTLPGIKEHMIDLGRFWSAEALGEKKAEICELNRRKQKLYEYVYGYLRAVREYEKMIYSDIMEAFIPKKFRGELDKISAALKGRTGKSALRLRSGITAEGEIVLSSYASVAGTRYALVNYAPVARRFLKELYDMTKQRCSICISYDPVFREYPNALYYPESDVSFYIDSENDYEEKRINMGRFIEDMRLRPYKSRIKKHQKLKNQALSSMYIEYGGIKRLHTELESIYSGAMDFAQKERFVKSLICDII